MTGDRRLRYFIALASNIGQVAAQDAKAMEAANKQMAGATAKTDKALQQTDKTAEGLGNTLGKKLPRDGKAAETALQRVNEQALQFDRNLRVLATNSALEKQTRYLDRLAQGYDRLAQRSRELGRQLPGAIGNGLDRVTDVGAVGAAGYLGVRAAVGRPLKAYSDLESATTDLKVAMMDAAGKVDKSFGAIAAEAVALGNKLPGTTADYMSAARALVEQGTPPDVIAKGGLRAASYFGVLMGMDQHASAETVAKLREAHGLKDNELVPMADLMQRGRYAFGINPEDYRMVAAYAAPTYNTMGLTGLDNAKKLLAIQGMAAGVGLESSSFGTNFAQMLERIGQIDGRTGKKSKEAKEVRAALAEHGVDMSFYSDKGQFKGIENMLQELAKLRALNPLDQQHALKLMFGVEAGRPAQILVQKGLEEYRAALAKIDSQANIDQRITAKMDTFAMKLEALGGTITNAMAAIAAQTGEMMKPLMDKANDAAGAAGNWFQDHPATGTAAMGALALGGGALAVRGASRMMQIVRGAGKTGAEALKWPTITGASAEVAAKRGGARALAAGLGRSLAGRAAGPVAATAMTAYDLYELGNAGYQLYDATSREGVVLSADARARIAAMPNLSGLGPRVDPTQDIVRLTDPRGQSLMGSAPGGAGPVVQLGEGRLAVSVTVSDERASVQSTVTQQMPLVRLDAGNTNPGSVVRR